MLDHPDERDESAREWIIVSVLVMGTESEVEAIFHIRECRRSSRAVFLHVDGVTPSIPYSDRRVIPASNVAGVVVLNHVDIDSKDI